MQHEGHPLFCWAPISTSTRRTPQSSIANGTVFEFVYDNFHGVPPPTFNRHNWAGHADDDDPTGKTRIDTFLVHHAAAHANQDTRYLYEQVESFDHVPIKTTSQLEAFTDTMTVAVQPAKIRIRNLQELSVKQRTELLHSE